MQPTGLRVDAAHHDPLYKQIFDQVVGRIRNGAWAPGHRLPPTRDLCRELGAHRNTVVRAYEDLEAAGFVVSTVGRGTFVAQQAPAPRLASSGAGAAPAVAAGLPWGSLVSRAALAETFRRADRLTRTAAAADAIDLSRMQPGPDLIPDELFRRCLDHVLRRQGARAMGYAPREGLAVLREAIAKDLESHGIPAHPDHLLVTSGSQQGLDLVARALINPGDTFLVEASTYAGALNLLAACGARVVTVPSDAEGPDLDALERLGRAGAKGLYLMPGCHNPTTRCISAERRRALVAWSRRSGVPLVEDDYVSGLDLDGETPPAALRTLDGDVLYVGSFSKKLAPALRIGFVLCPPALHPRLMALKHAMDLGSSTLLQLALAEFLERGYLRAHLGRVVPEYRARRDALEKALRASLPKQVGGVKLAWAHPRHGLILWLPLPPSLEPEAVHEEARRRGVLVSPSTLNTVDEAGEAGIRILYCYEPPDRIAKGARKLGQAITTVAERAGTPRRAPAEIV